MRPTIFPSRAILIAASLMLAACSLYQSSGRKSLENNGFAIANGTASLIGCDLTADVQGETLVAQDARAWVFQSDSDRSKVRVDLKDDSRLSCHYQFVSADAVFSHLNDIVVYTLDQRTVIR
jgi:hypothetical protein